MTDSRANSNGSPRPESSNPRGESTPSDLPSRQYAARPGDIAISDELAIALVEKRVFEVKTACGRKIIIVAIEKKTAP